MDEKRTPAATGATERERSKDTLLHNSAGNTSTSNRIVELPLDKITADPDIQMREGIDPDVVAEYAEAMKGKAELPPIVVYYDGEHYWLADGFHRLAAAYRAGKLGIGADIRNGGAREAILHATGANSTHGLRRTNADKRRAVMVLLNDDEWSKWSNREIARRCAVHHDTVGKIRLELSGENRQIPTERKVHRNGTTYTQNTANIGKTTTPEEEGPDVTDWLDDEPDIDLDIGAPDPDDDTLDETETDTDKQPSTKWDNNVSMQASGIVAFIDATIEDCESDSVRLEILNDILKAVRSRVVELSSMGGGTS